MTQLSPHFSLEELTASEIALRRGISNVPDIDSLANLRLLANALEEVHSLLNAPMIVNSAYRSPKINSVIGGSSNSAHMRGLACDFTAPAFGTPQEIAKAIVASDIDYDQVIYEGVWVHFAIGDNMRKQVLTARFNGGKATYTAGIV